MKDKEIYIPKALFEDIKRYCEFSGKDVNKYCVSSLRKQLAIDKYGDLNEKVEKPIQNKKEAVLVEKNEVPLIGNDVKEGEVPENVQKTNGLAVKIETEKEPETEKEEKDAKKHRTIKSR